MARWMKTDGTEQEVRPANGQEFTQTELHELIDGDLTAITLTPLSQPDGLALLLDDEGILKGKPVNLAATRVLWTHRPDYHQAGVWLHGAVVIATARETGDA